VAARQQHSSDLATDNGSAAAAGRPR